MEDYPGLRLVQWCRALPPDYGVSIAHLYLICSAPDVSPLFLEREHIWREFEATLTRDDIPLRMAARALSAAATISFVLDCLAAGNRPLQSLALPLEQGRKPLADGRAWRELAESFAGLTDRLVNANLVGDWLRAALGQMADPSAET